MATETVRIDTITRIHDLLGIPRPRHPLVSIIPIDERVTDFDYGDKTYVFGFYQVTLKSGMAGSLVYGRNSYDFQDGSMVFTQPGQAISYGESEETGGEKGWILLFHPDLIRQSELGNNIGKYSFFSYETNEALHVSEEERNTLSELVGKIESEYGQNVDRHTQKLIIANIKLILDYCTRYYDRQFHFRSNLNQDHLTKFEALLRDHFDSEKTIELGLPTVGHLAEAMNMSPGYMSDMLRKETGKNAQQHIQDALIERAKTLLLGSDQQISQIAFSLGFDYPQHFSKLFKSKTGMSPKEYRTIN